MGGQQQPGSSSSPDSSEAGGSSGSSGSSGDSSSSVEAEAERAASRGEDAAGGPGSFVGGYNFSLSCGCLVQVRPRVCACAGRHVPLRGCVVWSHRVCPRSASVRRPCSSIFMPPSAFLLPACCLPPPYPSPCVSPSYPLHPRSCPPSPTRAATWCASAARAGWASAACRRPGPTCAHRCGAALKGDMSERTD